MISLMLVDDQSTVRRAVRTLLSLEPDMCIVGEAADGVAALELASTLGPDVVVLDIEMPGMDGLTVAELMRSAAPATAIVMLSIRDSAAVRDRAARIGVASFLSKHDASGLLSRAIRLAAGQAAA